MKKVLSFTVLFLLFLMVCPAFALDVSVDIKGPQDLVSLKDGLTRTITARCLAKDVSAEGNAALNVSIFQMGGIISLDAILSSASKPLKAYHRDLKNVDELSGAIDAMIADIFKPGAPALAPAQAPVQAPAVVMPAAAASPQALAKPEAKFNFQATSMALVGSTLYVSSEDTIFKVDSGKGKPWWKAPKENHIFRLYPYKDSVLAVVNVATTLFTYQVRDGKTVKKWDRCVVPSKDGLISSRLFTSTEIPDGIIRWSKPETVEGAPQSYPGNTDVLSTLTGDVLPAAGGETISFDKWTHIAVSNGKDTLWSSEERFSTLPTFVEMRDVTKTDTRNSASLQENAVVRYYLMPRVLLKGSEIVSFANAESLGGFIGRAKIYDSTRIVAFKPLPQESEQPLEFDQKDLVEIKKDYCADIALDKGNVLALFVKKSTSYIQRIDLQ